MPRYVVSPHPGLLVPGNIDIDARAKLHVRNPFEGGFSTVDSVSFTFGRPQPPVPWNRIPRKYRHVEVLVPQVVRQGGRWVVVGPRQAVNVYLQTKRFLGIFDNIQHANAYGIALHNEQAKAVARG